MINRLISGLLDPRSGYFGSLQRHGNGPVRWSVFFAISVFNQLFFIAGFLYWRRFGLGRKVVFALLASIELFYWIATATAFGVVAMATTLGLSSLFSARTGRQTFRNPFVLLFGEMERDLVVQIGFLATPVPEFPNAVAQPLQHGRRQSTGLSTRVMAADNCSHFDCSAVSCLRPDRVSR